jgi:hypothetical protein
MDTDLQVLEEEVTAERRPNKNQIKEKVQNIGLLLLSLLLIYSLFEFVIFRNFLHYMPLRYQGYLHPVIRPLAQSSKKGVIPKNYILVLGDSYAAGSGDWVIKANEWTNPMYASHHVLHRLTGRDVISFGVKNRGSLSALAEIPVNYFRYLNKTRLYKTEPPEEILVYFYEGNDLDDNVSELVKKYEGPYPVQKIYDKKYFRKFIEKKGVNHSYLSDELACFSWQHDLFFLRMILEMLTDNIKTFFKPKELQPKQGRIDHGSKINVAVIRGKKALLPKNFQGPSMELTEEELNLGIYVFEHSLNYLAENFPSIPIFVVYIPSPLSIYQMVSPEVSVQENHERGDIYPTAAVRQRSDQIAQRIKEIARARGIGFIDTRPHLRKAAEGGAVHGVFDMRHFNQKGYTVLAEAIAPYVA